MFLCFDFLITRFHRSGVQNLIEEQAVEKPVLLYAVVVRLEGTNADLGREVLANSDVDIIAAESLTGLKI